MSQAYKPSYKPCLGYRGFMASLDNVERTFLLQITNKNQGLGYSLVIGCLPSTHKALNLIPGISYKQANFFFQNLIHPSFCLTDLREGSWVLVRISVLCIQQDPSLLGILLRLPSWSSLSYIHPDVQYSGRHCPGKHCFISIRTPGLALARVGSAVQWFQVLDHPVILISITFCCRKCMSSKTVSWYCSSLSVHICSEIKS